MDGESFPVIDVEWVEANEAKDLAPLVRASNNQVIIEVPLSSVGGTQDPGDIASDYVDAILVGEQLAPLCQEIRLSRHSTNRAMAVRFHCHANEADDFSNLVHQVLTSRFIDSDEEFIGEYADLDERLYLQQPDAGGVFPELADDYMANLLHASAAWEDEEVLKNYRKQFPESRFGFWKSFLSHRIGFSLYFSVFAWLAPPTANMAQALCDYGFWNKKDSLGFHKAKILKCESLNPILISNSCCVRLPLREIRSATECSDYLTLFEPFTENPPPKARDSWLLSDDGDVVIFKTDKAQHIAFTERLSTEEAEPYLSQLDQQLTDFRRVLGVEIHTPCAWGLLDGDSFEQLCYDITRRIGWFDTESVRKMGLSNSRDGGRDIVAFSKSRPGHTPQKWIIQCKYLGTKASLSGSSMHVSDCIDQYGADGFCVMTNAVIDATLYDKLDGLDRNRSVSYRTLSGMEIERFLQTHRDLLARYFPSTQSSTSNCGSTVI